MRTLDVAVVGAGTAGAAAALFLARAGHRVTLFERVPAPRPVGAGIILQPSGMAVMARLGLLEPVVARGTPLSGLRAQTPKGFGVVELHYKSLGGALYGLGLHRGVLFEALFGAASKQAGVTLALGVEVTTLDRRGDKTFLRNAKGVELGGPFDLVVVCDGARSSLRDDTGLVRKVARYPWGALWFVARDEQRVFGDRLFQVVRGTRRLFGLLPSGLGPSGSVPLVSVFWSIRGDQVEAFRSRPFEEWKAEALSYAPHAKDVLDQIHGHQDLLFSEYWDVVMQPWHAPGVVYLGDAAHAMSPQLGQGCNLALCDAAALADALALDAPLESQLAAYTQSRRAHLGWYQFITRALTPFFQSDLWWLGPIRNLSFGLLCRMPFFGRQMLEAMAGLSLGPFRPGLPRPTLPALRPGTATESKISE